MRYHAITCVDDECDPTCEIGDLAVRGAGTLPRMTETLPGRVVDAEHRGWMLMGTGDSPEYLDASDYATQRFVAPAQLDREYGPLRPVVPASIEDVDQLRAAWGRVGRQAVYTTAVAVQVAFELLRSGHGGLAAPDSYDLARRQLVAGRPGSWESARLFDIQLWADPGKVKRYNAAAADEVASVIVGWVSNPDRYVEVAENLSTLFSEFTDEAGGWTTVADQWLQRGGLDREGMFLTYSLFYACGREFDPDVLAS